MYGGKIMSNISKPTKYMVVSCDAGPAKLEKVEKFGTKHLTEGQFFNLIRTMPCKRSTSSEENKSTKELKVKDEIKLSFKIPSVDLTPAVTEESSGLMWVDKYKPTSMNQVIGQQDYNSRAKKLSHWLENWWMNNSFDKKAQKNWNSKEDGSVFKAVLLSGPPGVGKTTTAQLVCQDLGLNYSELNASDTRSKKSLQTKISNLLTNKTISSSLKGEQLVQKHVIIFDELDGMSGNEDRGGTKELIALIRNSKIPVICICNDRQHSKIRSLANHCFDLRFLPPRVEQIKGAMMSLLHREKIKLLHETLHGIIIASNLDIRQILHYLSFLSSKDVQELKHLKPLPKDVTLGPFDVVRRVFEFDEQKATINDKTSLFFHDYSLAAVFVQENYPRVKPMIVKADMQKKLELLSQAADSISYGDTIDRCIRSNNNWSILPTQAIFSSVIPGECMHGNLTHILFPSWLGKNSSRNHMDRVLQQIHMHTRLRMLGNKTELVMDYLQFIKENLTEPLINYGNEMVPQVKNMMENYYLLREDLDSIVELTRWPSQKDPMTSIDTKTKAALTRALNKEGHKNPYANVNIKKGKKRSVDACFDDEEGVEEREEEEDDCKSDAMVKLKKPAGAKASKQGDESHSVYSKGKRRGKPSTSGRGRGRGKKYKVL